MKLADRLPDMARSVQGKHFWYWPAWSTGEQLAVILVLNHIHSLREMDHTMLEAMDRLSGEVTVQQLLAIQREVRNG